MVSSANEKPIHSAPYGSGLKAREFDKNKSDKMLLEEVTEPAQTDWAAPIALVPRKDGSSRF